MKPAVPDIHDEVAPAVVSPRLAELRRLLRRRAVVAAVLAGCGAASTILLALGTLDRLYSFQETTALLFGLVPAGATAGFVLFRFGVILLRSPQLRDIALAVEQRYEDLMDVLVCAVEVEERAAAGESPRPLEQLAVARAAEQCRKLDLVRAVLPKRLRLSYLAGVGLLYALLAVFALHTPFAYKMVFRWREVTGSGPAGLVVQPGDAERPYDSDVRVTAEIRRWRPEAVIEFTDGGPLQRFPMNRTGRPRVRTFTFYSIRSPIRYRVATPALHSGWYRIVSYHSPGLRHLRMLVSPPAYTGRKPVRYDEPVDVTAVARSTVQIEMETERCVSAVLAWGGETRAFDSGDQPGRWRIEVPLTQSGSWSIELEDGAGHSRRVGPFRMTALPDLAPIIEIIDPVQDVATTPDRPLDITARAADDFGIDRIAVECSISGGPRRRIVLYAGGGVEESGDLHLPRADTTGVERSVRWRLDPKQLGAREGDVAALFFTATDNRAPDPQTSRSKVRFIEFRPDLSQVEQRALGGQRQELDLSPLIAELKRLIRLTWDLLDGPAAERERGTKRLAGAMRDLQMAASRVLNRVGAVTGGLMAGRVPELLGEAVREIGRARTFLESGLLEPSLQPQERGLARLTAAQAELLKNAAAAARQGQGKQSSSKKQKAGKGEKQQEAAQRQDRRKQMQALQRLAEQLRRLAVEQGDLNERMRRSLPEELPGLGDRERRLEERARLAVRDLEAIPPARGAAEAVKGAAAAMETAAGALASRQSRGGLRYGRQAHSLLEQALEQVRDAYRELSAEELDRLAENARRLAAEERRAAQQSRGLAAMKSVPQEELKAATRKQTQLNEATEALLSQSAETGAMVQERFPQAAEAILSAVRRARESGLPARQKRALNALRYRRLDRAARYQTDAANRLLELASNLDKAAGRFPRMSVREIRRALERMRALQRQAAQAARAGGSDALNRLEQIRRQAQEETGWIAGGLRNETLRQIAGDLGAPMGGTTVKQAGNRLVGLLTRAIRVLERYTLTAELRRRTRLYRQSATPPEKYRRLVEQYFRDLSEGE